MKFIKRYSVVMVFALNSLLPMQAVELGLLFKSKWDEGIVGLSVSSVAWQVYSMATVHRVDEQKIEAGSNFVSAELNRYLQQAIVTPFRLRYGLSLDVCFCVGLEKTFVKNNMLYVNILPLIIKLLNTDFSFYSQDQQTIIQQAIIFSIRHELARGLVYERSWVTIENAKGIESIIGSVLQATIYTGMRTREYGVFPSLAVSCLPELIPSFALKKIEKEAIFCDEIAGDSLPAVQGGIVLVQILRNYTPFSFLNNARNRKNSLGMAFELPCDERLATFVKRIELFEKQAMSLEKDENESDCQRQAEGM